MKEKDFDTRLKDRLDHLEEPYDPASWAAMEQRLNAPFVEEDPAPVDLVDKAVYHKLQQIEVPYQPAHWNLLANRLYDLRRLRMRLWVSKAAEAAIFLLLLVNLNGTWGDQKPVPAAPAKPRFNGPVAAVRTPASHTHSSAAAAMVPGGQLGLAADGNALSLVESLQNAQLPTMGSLTQPGDAPVNPASAVSGGVVAASFGPLALLSSNIFSFDWLHAQPALPSSSRIASAALKPHAQRFYFASFVGTDQNRVFVDGQTRQFRGFNTGFTLGYRQGKWGLEAGLAYAQKQYEPKKKVEIYAGNVTSGYVGSYLANVDADLISIPVKVTRRIGKVGKTSVHAVAGVTTNIAAQKSYHYKTVQFPGSAPSSQGPNTIAAQPQLRQTGRGVFENGNLTDNIYASADVGLRLERPIAGRWTVFVEPTYRQSLSSKGLGPRPAKINTFSLQAGVMAGL